MGDGGGRRVGAWRRVGLAATVLLALGLGYHLGWHVVQGGLPSGPWVVSGVLAVVAAVVAVAAHRSAGPRWDLRACLGLCVLTLAVMTAGASLGALDDALTASMMDVDTGGGAPWAELVLLTTGVVALAGSWPALAAAEARPV